MFPKYEHRDQPIYAKLHTYQCNYPARFHKHVEVLAVVKTDIRLTIQSTTYTLYPGDLYIAFPNLLHAIEARSIGQIARDCGFHSQNAFSS